MNMNSFYSIHRQWVKKKLTIVKEYKQTYIYEGLGGGGISKGASANEWGLTKYYMMLWSTIVGRFGIGGGIKWREEEAE